MTGSSSVRLTHLVTAVSVIAGALIFAIAPVGELDLITTRVLGLTIVVVALWVTGVVPPSIPSLILFAVVMIFGLAPASVTFSGFGAGAAWLTFTGVVFGLAIHRTGLGERIADLIVRRCGRSYGGAVTGMTLAGFVFCFLMPSAMGRCAILVPLVVALADVLGFEPGRRGRTGLILATVFSTVLAGYTILPAGIPNIVMAGAAESLFGVVLRFAPYMLIHFPVAGVLTLATVILLTLVLFKDKAEEARAWAPVTRPWSPEELRLGGIVCVVLLLWTTDFLHGISPAWVGLAGTVLCVLPGIGAVDADVIAKDCDYTPWIFTVGVVSLGAIIAESGLGALLGSAMFSVTNFEAGADARNFATLIAVFSGIATVTTTAGVPPLLTPMAQDIATAAGWPLITVLMAHTAGQFVVLYPYQIPPILTGALLGRVSLLSTTLMALCWSAVYLAVIAPLSFLWWRWLGLFE